MTEVKRDPKIDCEDCPINVEVRRNIRCCETCTAEHPAYDITKVKGKTEVKLIRGRKYSRKYREGHLEQVRIAHRKWMSKLKTEAFSHYSKGLPRCECCGETILDFLSLDHIDGNGTEHRKKNKLNTGVQTYLWVKRNNYPIGFQVLCFNCNLGKKINNNVCPHKKNSQKGDY